MSLMGRIGGLSRDTLLAEGTPDEVAAKEAALLREKRIEHARSMRAWVEHRETDFVRRPPAYLIHAGTDEAFTIYAGAVFDPGTAYVAFNADISMNWYVDAAGVITFLERCEPRTWSELLERRAAREQRRLAEEAARKARRDELRKGARR